MIPIEHQLKCEGCGKMLDMRDISVLCHGWIENSIIVCYDNTDVTYSSSRKLGDNKLWTKDKRPIGLN